jgi:hypothetical protein
MKPITRTLTLFSLGAGLLALPLLCRGTPPATDAKPVALKPEPAKPVLEAKKPAEKRRIQVALLLDTSSSMDGLIGQAKTQLWKIVNELSAAKKDGVRPEIEIALYEYGKSSLEAAGGYVRMILPLTSDLDKVSEELFALTTNGGEEYCGKVIKVATDSLTWSKSQADLKLMFIAGNEPFTQGDVDYRDAVRAASQKGITVNTIFCGARSEGIATGWQAGSLIADGRFLAIDQDTAVAHVDAPQDAEIAQLGVEINDTYIPYGAHGASSYARQQAQDMNASESAGSLMQRSVSKASGAYRNATWDLVDANNDGNVDLSKVQAEHLPENMRKMTPAEREAYVKAKTEKRAEIQKRIAELNVERTKFVSAELAKQQGSQAQTLDAAMIAAVRDQASKSGFRFE